MVELWLYIEKQNGRSSEMSRKRGWRWSGGPDWRSGRVTETERRRAKEAPHTTAGDESQKTKIPSISPSRVDTGGWAKQDSLRGHVCKMDEGKEEIEGAEGANR
jgi:hypothetical protein